jgi:hypothetical protein
MALQAVFDVCTSVFPGLPALGIDLAPFPKIQGLVERVSYTTLLCMALHCLMLHVVADQRSAERRCVPRKARVLGKSSPPPPPPVLVPSGDDENREHPHARECW